MKHGKISESILKRSVLKNIKTKQEEVVKSAGIGEDCAFFKWKTSDREGDCMTAVSTQTMVLPIKNAVKLAIYSAANNIAAGGAKPIAVMLSIILPEKGESKSPMNQTTSEEKKSLKGASNMEQLLKEIMQQAGESCEQLAIEIAGGHTEVSEFIQTPIITATAIGKREGKLLGLKDVPSEQKGNKTLEIVMSKWAGIEGTTILAQEKEEELLQRYSLSFIKQAQGFEQFLSCIPEAATAVRSGVYGMHDIRTGGIFAALWELSKQLCVGLTIDLKKIPMKQETIEICEFFNLNPYELLSGGAMLMATTNGEALVRALELEGISAAVIGQTTGTNDKILMNDDEVRYLEPAKTDEIYKINFPIGGSTDERKNIVYY